MMSAKARRRSATLKANASVSKECVLGTGTAAPIIFGSTHGFHIRNEISTLLLLFQTCEHHFGPHDVFLGVYQVLKHVLFGPDNAGVFVSFGICKAIVGA